MRKETKREISQKRVLDAAAKIFRDKGYAGTTMRSIADMLDIKAGSIYYHYKSKEDLINAVMEFGNQGVMDRVKTALAELPEAATGRERLKVAVRAHIVFIMEFGDYALATRRVLGQVPEAVRTHNLRLRESYTNIWRKLLTDAHARGEFRSTATFKFTTYFIFGALNWTVEWFRPGGTTVEKVADEFTSLLLDGLAAEDEAAVIGWSA